MLRSTKVRQLIFTSFLALSLVIVGCSEDDDDPAGPQTDEGFVAEAGDFSDYETWTQVDYTIYPAVAEKLGPAHSANNTSAARMIYTNPESGVTDGEYDQGSVVVKETFTWTDGTKVPAEAGAFLAMAKRGGDFNTDNGGWEYFKLGADAGEIASRGTTTEEIGQCQACHSAATGDFGMDWVFEHPAEYMVPEGEEFGIFDNPTSWQQIDSLFGPDPALGPAHGGGDLHRVIYRWQPGAMYANGQFPVGTVLAKETYELDDSDQKTNITWTGMVKRGGDFNPDNGNWEWFMMDPTGQVVLARGGATNNMTGDPLGCNGCHSAAANGGGGDFVFNHDGLGF